MKFAGIVGQVIKKSPHGSFTVIQLSDRVAICGSPNNKQKWPEFPESESGFKAFILYLGCDSQDEANEYEKLALEKNAEIVDFRESKYLVGCLFELKVQAIAPEAVVELMQLLG
jgi:hypothetical protein